MIRHTNEDELLIGIKRTQTIRTKYNQHTESHPLTVTMDFTGAQLQQIIDWALRDRLIRFQNRLRQMETEELFRGFHEAGDELTIFASHSDIPISQHHGIATMLDRLTKKKR